MFWFIIFDFIYTDILVEKLILTDRAQDTDYAGMMFLFGNFIKLEKKGGWNELKTIKSSNKCIIDTKQFTFNVAWCIYCMWHKETNETDKLFAKQLKTAHNALHVIKLANRSYRVTVLYSLYYPKLKQTY